MDLQNTTIIRWQLPTTYFNKLLMLLSLIGCMALVGCSDTENEDMLEIVSSEDAKVAFADDFAARTVGSVIAIKARVNGKYLSSENGSWMTTNRDEPNAWEKFTVVDAGDGYIGLLANNGKYVCTEDGGDSPLIANRDNVAGDWEKFKFEASGSYFGIKCKTGRYVCAEEEGTENTIANRTALGFWEEFTIEVVDGSSNSGTASGTFELDEFGIETAESCDSSTSTTTEPDTELDDGGSYEINDLEYYRRSGNSYILTSCEQKGRRTEWKQSSKFSLNSYRKMSYRAKFYDYPSDGVTIAQIHNRGDAGRPLLRIEIIHGKIEFVIVDTYVKNSGNSHPVDGPSYSEGSYLDLSLETGSNEIIATVTTTSGSKTVKYTKNNSNDDYSINNKWFESGVISDFYFKAGVYNDSGNGSDMPVASFTSFEYDE